MRLGRGAVVRGGCAREGGGRGWLPDMVAALAAPCAFDYEGSPARAPAAEARGSARLLQGVHATRGGPRQCPSAEQQGARARQGGRLDASLSTWLRRKSLKRGTGVSLPGLSHVYESGALRR
jgi:hypothetical protein